LEEIVTEFYPQGLPDEHKATVNGIEYLALVPKILHVGVHLDIQMFTPSQRRRPGDVDNRVKTLIDGATSSRLLRRTSKAPGTASGTHGSTISAQRARPAHWGALSLDNVRCNEFVRP